MAVVTEIEREVLARVEQITPERATELLALNTHNRNVRQNRVVTLAGAMQRGEWMLNGESIKVAADGRILDGQHRLLAVVESGSPIESLIVYGLQDGAQETIDIGAARTVADMLKGRGHVDTNVLAAATRLIFIYDQFGTMASWARNQVTPQQVLATVDRNPDILHGHKIARLIAKGGLALSPSWSVALYYLMSRDWDERDTETFFVRLAYGDNLSSGDPIYQLRSQLLQERVKHQRRQPPLVIAAITIKAFNAWISGENPKFFRWAAGGRAKEPFPQIMTKEESSALAA